MGTKNKKSNVKKLKDITHLGEDEYDPKKHKSSSNFKEYLDQNDTIEHEIDPSIKNFFSELGNGDFKDGLKNCFLELSKHPEIQQNIKNNNSHEYEPEELAAILKYLSKDSLRNAS
jgi:hypothetical protein